MTQALHIIAIVAACGVAYSFMFAVTFVLSGAVGWDNKGDDGLFRAGLWPITLWFAIGAGLAKIIFWFFLKLTRKSKLPEARVVKKV